MSEMAIMVAHSEAHRKEIEKELGMKIVVVGGDTKLVWNVDNKDEVEAAREAFDKLIRKGFTAFSVDKRGEASDKVKRFDATLEKIILVPQMAGG